METVEVDGSYGEGGGQILRTAAAFSIIQNRPIHVTKIRSGREVPGLRRQHAASLEILRSVSGGRLEGAHVGSTEVNFFPGTAEGATLSFDLGTAASITLVLQAVIPAASLSGAGIRLDLVGGTDVPWSPTYDYLATVVREAFSRIGIRFTAEAYKRGYYPKGGGRVSVDIEPCASPRPLVMTEAAGGRSVALVSRCSSLPRHVAQRQLDSATSALRASGVSVGKSSVVEGESDSPGSSILVHEVSPDRLLGADAIGSRGKRAEVVGSEAASRFLSAYQSGACVDSNLADMVAPILAISKAESRLRIPEASLHLRTSLYVAKLFTGCEWRVDKEGSSFILSVSS
ncbi:MAG: RNA 3'-terminal phosphate cyclase [Nitrososphaerales archaeon]|nr:RNA 3'-terminal phosphate cyclase [Nitrososphaerales archaeon]